jgi:hypothetical protein
MLLRVTLTRTTANLIPRAAAALDAAAAREGISRTDIINRAVVVYDVIAGHLHAGDKLFVEHPDGTTERMLLL